MSETEPKEETNIVFLKHEAIFLEMLFQESKNNKTLTMDDITGLFNGHYTRTEVIRVINNHLIPRDLCARILRSGKHPLIKTTEEGRDSFLPKFDKWTEKRTQIIKSQPTTP